MTFKVFQAAPSISDCEISAVVKVLQSGEIGCGTITSIFEEEFANYVGVKYAVATNSCASALMVALLSNNISGEVIVPSLTFVASANSIIAAGATPVFADSNPDSLCVSPHSIERLVSENTEAIMVVHFAGQCCAMAQIEEIAKKYSLLIIEDSAQCLGGTFENQVAGSFGEGCFSFFPSKNITTGEGGMFTTNSSTIAEKARKLVGHGILKRKDTSVNPWNRIASLPGHNFRMSNINAAIGISQLGRLSQFLNSRQIVAEKYDTMLSEFGWIGIPRRRKRDLHSNQMYVAQTRKNIDRDAFVNFLRKEGIEVSIHFDPILHQMSAFSSYKSDVETATLLAKTIVSLPMHTSISSDDIDLVYSTISKFERKHI